MAAVAGVGAAGKAMASQAMKSMSQSQMTKPVANQAQKISKFQKVMQTQQKQVTPDAAQAGQIQKTKFQAAQQKVQARNKIQQVQKGSMNKLINSVVKGQNKMDKIMQMATSGKKFSPQELMAMQTGMYRYTHELEMVTKIVEKTTEGVKKTMSTQV